jgi:hypothetical protein
MFFCAHAATFGPGLEEEPDITPARPAATKEGIATKEHKDHKEQAA